MICRLTPQSCVMYAGLRLAKTFVCCCPDQLNKRLTDSKIESVRRKLCSVRAKSTFVVASSQSQRVAFMMRSATVTFAINISPQRVMFAYVWLYQQPAVPRFQPPLLPPSSLPTQHNECSQAEQCTFLFVIHLSATPILAARARCMFIIS